MKSLPSTPAPVDNGPVDSLLLSRLLLLLEIPRGVIAAASPRAARERSNARMNSCDSSLELMSGLDVLEHDLSSFEFPTTSISSSMRPPRRRRSSMSEGLLLVATMHTEVK